MSGSRKTARELIKFSEDFALPIMRKRRLISKGWVLKFGSSQVNYGLCDSEKKIITISKYFLLRSSEKEIIDTLRHEIAHALVGSEHQHNTLWKKKYLELGGRKKAYNRRLTNAQMRYRWHGSCSKKHEFFLSSAPRTLNYCTQCSDSFNDKSFIYWEPINNETRVKYSNSYIEEFSDALKSSKSSSRRIKKAAKTILKEY